jgi:hypothetical protein
LILPTLRITGYQLFSLESIQDHAYLHQSHNYGNLTTGSG